MTSENYRLVKYETALDSVWDGFIQRAVSSTFLHTRKFLTYHGNKFDDQSLLIYDKQNNLRGLFPAALDPGNKELIISHPGSTYGGIVHDGWLRGQRCLGALSEISDYYKQAGIKSIIYKAVPWIYHRRPAQDDIYALFRLGAQRYRVDLSSTIDLESQVFKSKRRERTLSKANVSDLTVSDDFQVVEKYWSVLEGNLETRYNKKPIHSLEEILVLQKLFSREIELISVSRSKELVAGFLLFHCGNVVHAQYIASTFEGRKSGALDLGIEYIIQKAISANIRFFDFGISTDNQGQELNDNLYTFKSEFGAGGSVYEFYRIDLVKTGG